MNVIWYGGEPLLATSIIEELSVELIKLCDENQINYTASIVTNGILLDLNIAKKLKEKFKIVSAQITIDGLEETHNNRRILKSKENSFQIIINNINNIKDIIDVVIRINVDKENYEELESFIDYILKEKNWGNKVKLYFYPIVLKNTPACNVNINKCLKADEFGLLEGKLLRKIFEYSYINSIYNLYVKHTPAFCTAICTNSFVIDPEGFLYPCWDFIGMKEKRIGHISKQLSVNEEYSKWLLLEIPSTCNKCKLLPLCKGGCPSARIYNNNTPFCEAKYKSLNEKLKIIYDNYKKMGE